MKSIHSVIFCIFPHSESLQKRNLSCAVAHEHRDVPGTLRQWKIRGKSSGGNYRGLEDFPWIYFPMNRLDSSKGKDPLELDADFSPKIHRFPEDHLTLGYFGHFSAKTRNTNRTATARPQKKSTNLENLGSATHLECSKYTKVYVTLRKYRQQWIILNYWVGMSRAIVGYLVFRYM